MYTKSFLRNAHYRFIHKSQKTGNNLRFYHKENGYTDYVILIQENATQN